VNVAETVMGVQRDARTPFERWVEDTVGLETVRGYAAGPLGKLAVRPWAERNLDAVFVDLIGAESLAGMFVFDLKPGASSKRWRQVADETFYVLSGNGSTTIETPSGTISFEWGERALFAIPLNCPYVLHNGSGTQKARLVSVNTLPIVYSLYRDPAFVFGTNHDFARLDPKQVADPTRATLYHPDEKHVRTAVDLYDTLLIPDVLRLQRTESRERGENSTAVYIETAKSSISDHVAEIPGRAFFNPHRHGPSAYVFTLTGKGYSLLWQDAGAFIRYDWPENDVGVVVPPNMWWHGHFVTTPNALTLAIKLRSRFNPISHLYENTHIRVKDGGTVLHFEDLHADVKDKIWDMYVEECGKEGYEVKRPRAAVATA